MIRIILLTVGTFIALPVVSTLYAETPKELQPIYPAVLVVVILFVWAFAPPKARGK